MPASGPTVRPGESPSLGCGPLALHDLSQPHGAALDQATVNDYISIIADTCKDESPSSLLVQ